MDARRTLRIVSAVSLALCLAALTGCMTKAVPPPAEGSVAPYRVGPPDRLSVVVLPQPSIEREVVVRPDGMLSLDLIGDVPAVGRTLDEIGADIQQRMRRYKRDAAVTVSLLSAESTAITVLGEVRSPQSFPLTKQVRVAEAIGRVGGETLFAADGRIRVIRSGSGETVVYKVDLDAIRSGDLRTNILLASGDIVYVPPNVFATIGYAVNALLFPIQPLLGIANSAAGSLIAR